MPISRARGRWVCAPSEVANRRNSSGRLAFTAQKLASFDNRGSVRHVVLVSPPAVERAGKAWELMGAHPIVICADYEQAALWADAAPAELRAHAVTGLARTAALLKEGRVGVLAGAPSDLAALVARAALKLETIDTVVLAWPESFATEPALEIRWLWQL